MKNSRGFILAETLVAMLIMGIISTVTITLIVKANIATANLQKSLLCYPNDMKLGCKAVIVTDVETGCKSIIDGKGRSSAYRDEKGTWIGCANPPG